MTAKTLSRFGARAIQAMEKTHANQLADLLSAASFAFGRSDALALVERTVFRLLDGELCYSAYSTDASIPVNSGALVSTDAQEKCEASEGVYVHGLPEAAKWERLPVELKLVKSAVAIAKSSANGVVLRSKTGAHFYATYDSAKKLMKVPSSYGTSRNGCQSHIPLNGAYQWVLVGVVQETTT